MIPYSAKCSIKKSRNLEFRLLNFLQYQSLHKFFIDASFYQFLFFVKLKLAEAP